LSAKKESILGLEDSMMMIHSLRSPVAFGSSKACCRDSG
jgi:hypothetical protein